MRSKVAIVAISGMYAGLAGALSASFRPYVSSDSFPAVESFTYVIMAVVGGLGTVWGGVAGAVVVSALLQVLALLFMPRGLDPSVDGAFDPAAGRRKAGEPA